MKIRRGFTLIELLVVIAIISLLLSVIVPAIRMAKRKAASAVCLTNVKNLSLGWYLYQEDNSGEIMWAAMEDVGTLASAERGWIGTPHTLNDKFSSSLNIYQTSPAVTDEDEIRGVEKGVLYPYVKTSDAYHCPADKYRKGPDGTYLYVSYCLSAALYGKTNPSYNRQIKKFTQITSPSMRYNFVESGEKERGNWIAGGHFIMATPEYGDGGYGWWSPIAINHGDSSVFGFCDGHASCRKWRDQDTFEHYAATINDIYYGKRIPEGQMGDDLSFLARGWAYRYRP